MQVTKLQKMLSKLANLTLNKGSLFSNVVKSGVIISSLAAGSAYLAFNSRFIDYPVNALSRYEHGIYQPLSGEVVQLCNEALNDIDLPNEMKQKCKFFHAIGTDVCSIGSLHFGKRVFIGLPTHFDISSIEEFCDDFRPFRQEVNWNSRSGAKLQESFKLSSDALKFAIVRSLYFCDSYRIHLQSVLISTSFLITHLLYYAMNRKLSKKLTPVPKSVKIFIYAFSCVVGYFTYCQSASLLIQYYEKLADRRAILLENGNYYEGSLEYYGKILQRNAALRSMMGEGGSKYFTREGNFKQRIDYVMHLPITTRISEIEDFKNPYGTRQ